MPSDETDVQTCANFRCPADQSIPRRNVDFLQEAFNNAAQAAARPSRSEVTQTTTSRHLAATAFRMGCGGASRRSGAGGQSRLGRCWPRPTQWRAVELRRVGHGNGGGRGARFPGAARRSTAPTWMKPQLKFRRRRRPALGRESRLPVGSSYEKTPGRHYSSSSAIRSQADLAGLPTMSPNHGCLRRFKSRARNHRRLLLVRPNKAALSSI